MEALATIYRCALDWLLGFCAVNCLAYMSAIRRLSALHWSNKSSIFGGVRDGLLFAKSVCLVPRRVSVLRAISRHLWKLLQLTQYHPFHLAIALSYNDFNQNSLPDDLLTLVNERVLRVTY